MAVRGAAPAPAAPGNEGNRGGASVGAQGGGAKPQGRHGCCRGGSGGGILAKSSLLSLLSLLVLGLGPADAIWGPELPPGLKVLHASIVMRHGERTRLQKTVSEAEFGDNDGVVLTIEGEQDSYNLGAQLRERYMPINATHSEASSTTIEGLTLWYDADRVQFESSGYDRTLESATALAFGLYPVGQEDEDVRKNSLFYNHEIVVPIHSKLPENDPVILGHDKCPVFNDEWQETYLSEEFLNLQNQATKDQGDKPGFVTQVYENFQTWNGGGAQDGVCYAEAVDFEANQLQFHAPYNLWDCAKTAYAAGDTTAVDIIEQAQLPPEGLVHFGLDEDKVYLDKGWLYLEYLVYEIEDGKYKQNVVGRMAGGLYLTQLKQRMMEVREHVLLGRPDTAGRFPGLHITSGHYGTLKGIAAALDLGGLEGIPPYTSHLTFELLYDEEAAALGEEDVFSVRILYQSGTNVQNLDFKLMGIVFDGSFSESISDEELASQRNDETGIMPWDQWLYLLNIQNMGDPAIYTAADPEQEWCEECLATTPNACLRLEVEILEHELEMAEAATSQAVSDKEAVDDGVGGTHVALLSIFGLILGIGIGICIRPCVDRINNKSKSSNSRAVSGDRGLESWSSSAGNSVNGSFRLGAKNPSTRHVMGAVDSSQMVPVRASDYADHSARMNGNGNGSHYDEEDAGAGSSSIPSFAPTSALGEPVPFPHRRQPSGMVSGVDSSMMSGIDAEDDGDDVMGGGDTSRELLEFN